MADSFGPKVVWEEAKNDANRRKLGVSFEQASRIFAGDGDYLEIFDDQHSDDEDRFLVIGPITLGLVVVAYTEREDETVRILSARRATRRETERYRRYSEDRAR